MLNNEYIYHRINRIELLQNDGSSEREDFSNSQPQEKISQHIDRNIVPCAENVDFIERGRLVVRVMDHHNFYEAEALTEEYLKDAPIGLLTKIWISISKSLKE